MVVDFVGCCATILLIIWLGRDRIKRIGQIEQRGLLRYEKSIFSRNQNSDTTIGCSQLRSITVLSLSHRICISYAKNLSILTGYILFLVHLIDGLEQITNYKIILSNNPSKLALNLCPA